MANNILSIQALRINDRTYREHLKRSTDAVFEYAANVLKWDWHDLARHAKLSYQTVYRLGSRITQLPREQTFWKLACACGLSREFLDKKGTIIKPKSEQRAVRRG